MGRMLLAIRVFFGTLLSAATARRIEQALGQDADESKPTPTPKPKQPAAPLPPARSEAVTLLSTLQREARFVDFIKEPIDGYADAQIGAAVRDIHRDCATVLDRLFGLEPLLSDEEGAEVEVAAGFDPGRYKLSGNVTGEPPFSGQMVHHGWQATICKLPQWSGSSAAARVVVPAEVELK